MLRMSYVTQIKYKKKLKNNNGKKKKQLSAIITSCQIVFNKKYPSLKINNWRKKLTAERGSDPCSALPSITIPLV